MRGTLRPAPVRTATGADAEALYALSAPFMRSGALRPRTVADYRRPGDRFLMVPGAATGGGPDGELDGCVALRALPPEPRHPAAGLVHNFCVRDGRQGAGLGSRLLAALLAEAGRCGLRTLVTASTGDGALFLRSGFREIPVALAPRSWAAGLDPARGSRVFALTLDRG
ncbi:GNAT family N-acetyltransferase [Kitasatospora sp. NBC_00240]|uniref:GNAT family N-acetyltransferase n=1 Tax=Kitasatospora sp. NBC_00240 TaxID=2903567 RepID=UPI00224CB77F|nr:GNAT family N-acetyltransferase [Kitasatospora sp. NBC_00240]MCX5210033.1 GNAT family N-acetyltransferase [Kitasatospora sp. NBC_00240]